MDNVTDQVVTKLIEVVKKKNKGGIAIKPFQVRNFISLLLLRIFRYLLCTTLFINFFPH